MSLTKFLIGVIVGATCLYYFGPEKIIVEKQTERIEVPVETTVVKEIKVPIIETKTVVKEIKVPQIIEKVVIKEVEVPKVIIKPVIQHITLLE